MDIDKGTPNDYIHVLNGSGILIFNNRLIFRYIVQCNMLLNISDIRYLEEFFVTTFSNKVTFRALY
ncbi:MAG: hypothetical protein FWH18_01620 [Marinilabiliaceae bacterium]|nr:hypothetical protein [Marinilabiliaceae bacterium]